jgi:hypothetical protein
VCGVWGWVWFQGSVLCKQILVLVADVCGSEVEVSFVNGVVVWNGSLSKLILPSASCFFRKARSCAERIG